MLLGKIIKNLARIIPFPVYRKLIKMYPVGLCYHLVSDAALPHIFHYPYKCAGDFENDLFYLKERYNFLLYDGIQKDFSQKRAQRGMNSVFLSFDDGYTECFSVARPILLKYKAPCTFFVSTDFLDNKVMFYENKIALCMNRLKNYERQAAEELLPKISALAGKEFKYLMPCLTWITSLDYFSNNLIDEICHILGIDAEDYLFRHKPYLTTPELKTMLAEGFSIGAHGKRHIRMDLLSNEDMEREIVDSCLMIMDILGLKRLSFAFPYHVKYINRNFLSGILQKYPFIDLFFDAQSLNSNTYFLASRIWADPPPCNKNSSNLDYLLQKAYIEYLFRSRK